MYVDYVVRRFRSHGSKGVKDETTGSMASQIDGGVEQQQQQQHNEVQVEGAALSWPNGSARRGNVRTHLIQTDMALL